MANLQRRLRIGGVLHLQGRSVYDSKTVRRETCGSDLLAGVGDSVDHVCVIIRDKHRAIG